MRMIPAAIYSAAVDHSALGSEAGQESGYRLVGLLIVSLFPALFWTTLVALGSLAIGAPLSPLALATIGAAIAAILAAVFHALLART